MSIRVRFIEGVGYVALCAARSMPEPGDIYLGDEVHGALAHKFWIDYPEIGIEAPADVIAATEREESNNPNRTWWDSEYAASGPTTRKV